VKGVFVLHLGREVFIHREAKQNIPVNFAELHPKKKTIELLRADDKRDASRDCLFCYSAWGPNANRRPK
jgi:hypothetical protein